MTTAKRGSGHEVKSGIAHAWIRLGKWTAEEFADWSARAQQKKADCDSGAITEAEFAA